MSYYIEVEFNDRDDDKTVDCIGPYMSRKAVDVDCASLQRTIDAHPAKDDMRSVSVMVRSFRRLPDVRKEAVEYLDTPRPVY